MLRLLVFLFGVATALKVMSDPSPIAKVLDLLSSMESEIKADMKADAATSKKLQCWAATNREEKTKDIESAEAYIAETTSLITKLTGSTEQLKVNVAQLGKGLTEDEKDLSDLESDREKDAADFRKYETQITQSLQQLNGAITILKKNQGKSALVQLRKVLAETSLSFPKMSLLEDAKSAVALVEYSPHSSVSGEIFGILTQMLEQMDSELASRSKEEGDSVKTFDRMRKAKKEEIGDTRASLRKKKDALARESQDLSRAKKAVKESADQLAIDRKFLAEVEKKVAEDKEELASRVSAQSEELAAINDTVSILTSEETRAHFEKTKPSSFLQTLSLRARKPDARSRERASVVLKRAAAISTVSTDGDLSLLATQVQLASFDEIKNMIANLIKDLQIKKQQEVQKRDFCTAEFSSNAKESDETGNLMEDLTAKGDSLESKSKVLSEAIASTRESQKKLEISVATSTSLRIDSSKEYQQVFQDFLTTKDILNKAIVRLNAFYKGSSFLEQAPAPVGLERSGFKKKNGGGVVGLLRMIIEDAEKTATEAQVDEKKAQKAYENTMADFISGAGTLAASLTSQINDKATADEELSSTKADYKNSAQTLDDLQKASKALHDECDFLIANFDNRQKGFSQEAEALQQAIEILTGSH